MPDKFHCTKDTCPASESIIGYAPSLASSIVFIVLFLVSAGAHIFQGIRYKTWAFFICIALGNILEAIGYGGRIMLHDDPFSPDAFKLEVVLLTFSPAFYAAAIYLMLKHLILLFGPDASRIPAKFYTYIFISCDVFSMVLQGVGGGLASAADEGSMGLLHAGNNVMITGLSFQVATMIIFGLLSIEYFFRLRRTPGAINESTSALRHSGRFRAFLIALIVAYFAILFRCIYRVAELSQGWGSDIMRHEAPYIVFDPVMCVVAVVVLNVFHPGRCFLYFKRQPQTGTGTGTGTPIEKRADESEAEGGVMDRA